jgi:hypothetical protein
LAARPSAGFEAQREAEVRTTDEREALVAVCMKGAGFDYYAVPYGGPLTEEPHPYLVRADYLMVPPLDSDRAAVAQWGYGVDSEASVEDELFGNQDPAVREKTELNQQYVDSLSAAGRHEYQTALYGFDPEREDVQGKPPEGCLGEALASVPDLDVTPYGGDFRETYWDLLGQLTEVTTWDVGIDPRSVALDQEWQLCAESKGLDFSTFVFTATMPDGSEVPSSDMALLNRPSPGNAIRLARQLGEDGEMMAAGEGQAALRAYPAQVQVALADYDCRQQTDYMNRLMEIQRDVEQQFLDANRSALEEMAIAARG